REQRDGERLVLLAWVRGGGDRAGYDRDEWPLPADLAGVPVTPDLVHRNGSGPPRARLRTLIERRCADCHSENGREELARRAPLDSYDRLAPYLQTEQPSSLGLTKLVQSTHVHLLGFAVLYGGTGLLFCFTRYPLGLRAVAAPLPLAAQG